MIQNYETNSMYYISSKLLLILLLVLAAPLRTASRSNTATSKRDVLALSKWAKDEGILMHPNLEWKSNEGDDWGLILKRSVPRGTILLQVPRSLVLDSNAIKEKQSATDCEKVVEALGKFSLHEDNFWIVLQLYKLKCHPTAPQNKKFLPWLAAMPTTFPKFTVEEQNCLPFYAKYAAEYQDAKLEAFYQAAQVLEECNADNLDQASALKWAFQAVNSRFWKQNPLGQKQVVKATSELVPIGDMMNHRDPPNVQMVPEDPNYVTFAYLGDDKESSMDKHPGIDEKTEVVSTG